MKQAGGANFAAMMVCTLSRQNFSDFFLILCFLVSHNISVYNSYEIYLRSRSIKKEEIENCARK